MAERNHVATTVPETGASRVDTTNPPARSSEGRRSRRDLASAADDSEPFIATEAGRPPIAGPETDIDDAPDDDIPFTPEARPGIDDAFFPPNNPDDKDTRGRDGDAGMDDGFLPKDPIGRRDGPGEGGEGNDDEDKDETDFSVLIPNGGGTPFPYAPDFGPTIINVDGVPTILPDVNVYQNKKTLAQGMMDLALLSANANQLRYVLESYSRHPYYYVSIFFISFSIIVQIAVGVGLILNSRYNVKNEQEICKANKINNLTVLGVFLITIVNVFVSAFGVAEPPADMRA